MEYGVVRPLCKNKPECDAERVCWTFGWSKKGISEISSVEGGIMEVVAFRPLLAPKVFCARMEAATEVRVFEYHVLAVLANMQVQWS